MRQRGSVLRGQGLDQRRVIIMAGLVHPLRHRPDAQCFWCGRFQQLGTGRAAQLVGLAEDPDDPDPVKEAARDLIAAVTALVTLQNVTIPAGKA